MANKAKRGTFIHGIAASEHIDSSGERIKIDGVDITSLTKDGTFNYEHDSKSPSSIVGKILEAKKILKRSDCENEHQKYYWDKIKMPYIYVAGELFDSVGHKQASEVSAMLKYDQLEPLNKEAKKLINFSIEGSRVEKSGQVITKCIARKVSVTLTPCNKVCEADELIIDDSKKETDSGDFTFIQDVMSKADEASCSILKGENPYLYENMEKAEDHGVLAKPYVSDAQRKWAHTPKGKEALGGAKAVAHWDKESKGKNLPTKKNKLSKYDSNVRKALTASCGMGAPSTKVNGDALGKEEFIYKNEEMPAAPKQPAQGNKIGMTKSGKGVFSHAKVADYKDFSPQDHAEAADFHRQMLLKSPSFKDKEMHLNKMRLHTSAFNNTKPLARPDKGFGAIVDKTPQSKGVNPAVAPPAPAANPAMPATKPIAPVARPDKGFGAIKTTAQQPAAPAPNPATAARQMNPNLKLVKSEFSIIRMGEPDVNKGSKNVREQRKKVFGTKSQPGAGTAMREKHINHIKNFVSKHLGLDLQPSGGKVNDKTGERRNAENEAGVDKPDWRSGKFEAQWNPEAIVHEIAHLMLLPEGVGLEEGQRLMDKQYSDVQKEHGYMQQKRSKYEVQPMAAEQLIRRALGLPASQVSIPVKSKDDPHRMSLEDPTQPIATRIQQGTDKSGQPKYVDLIRQARNLHPEHKQRLMDIFSGKLKFHPDKGWQKNKTSLDAAITNRPEQAVIARQNKKKMAAGAPSELPPNVVRMKQPATPATTQPAISAQSPQETPQQPKIKIAKSEQRKIMKMLGDQAFERFEKKEELLIFLAEELPNVSKKERMALAKAVAYTSEKKKEEALKALIGEE